MPFEKGNNINPGGRGKDGSIWRDAIRRAIKRREESDPQALEKLANKLLKAVDLGDIQAMREFGNRLDGMPSQNVNHSGTIALTQEEAIGAIAEAANVGAGNKPAYDA